MKFSIHPGIFDRFPGLYIGMVVASGIDNQKGSPNLQKKIRDKEDEIRAEFSSDILSQHPNIQVWRKTYAAFGAKPKKYKSSIENLFRVVLKGLELRSINLLVNIYNYVSLKHIIPIGGDDLDRVDGGITLRFACGDEPFTPLNSNDTEFVKSGEVVYADEKEILCRRWNWRECDKTKMRPETKNAVLVLEGLPPVRRKDIERAVKDLSALIHELSGGETREMFLDVNLRNRDIPFVPQ